MSGLILSMTSTMTLSLSTMCSACVLTRCHEPSPFGPAGCVIPSSRHSMDICQTDLVVRLLNSLPTTLCLASAEPGKHFLLMLILTLILILDTAEVRQKENLQNVDLCAAKPQGR